MIETARMQNDTALEAFKSDSESLNTALDEHIRRHFAPDNRKTMRTFSAPEVAKILGMTPAHLRTLRHEGKVPPVGSDDARKSVQYTLAEVDEIRHALEARSRKKGRFVPHRTGDEKLQVFAICTFKGGSGKTTSCASIAMALAKKGYRVLACDLDPQASLSNLLGEEPEVSLREYGTIYDAIRFEDPVPMQEIIRKTHFHNLSIAPAGLILSEFEQYAAFHAREGAGSDPWHGRLKHAILSVEQDYDIVLIDCPPALGFLTMSAMVASTSLIITVVPNMIDVASLSQFIRMAVELMGVLTEFGVSFDFDFIRYLICRYEPTDAPQAQLVAFLRMQFGARLMTSAFLKSTVVSDAGMTNQTIYEIKRGEVTRTAYDRVMESFDAVSDELEASIRQAWGRD